MKEMVVSVQKLGYDYMTFDSTEECIAHLTQDSENQPDMILADADISGLDGFELLRMCQMGDINIPVLVFTGNDTLESASKALQFGAWDYVVKPVTQQRLSVSLDNLAERQRLKKEVRRLNKRLTGEVQFKDIIGQSHSMKRLFEVMRRACESDITVMLQGESGVGKEVVARALHHHSNRRNSPMVSVNCGAIPQNLVESELFGHVKGAFTSAVEERKGKFVEASGGTLFLDEIGDLDHAVQVKLLRALQDGEVIPVGSNTPVKVNIRLVVATNRNLRRMVHDGEFREDLFYRINVLPIEVPPLRDRRRDIPALATHFMESFCTDHDMKPKEFTPAAEKALTEFQWPGNVRQLENAMHRLAVMIDSSVIEKKHLDFLTVENTEMGTEESFQDSVMLSLEEVEKRHIRRVVLHCKGNMSQAARVLGVSRSTLYRQMDQIKAEALAQN